MSTPEENEPQQQRQTISFLKRRFREVGLQPASRHGQNFLIDMNLQQLLVDAADLNETDLVLEVGTGTGALTALLAQKAGSVITVEIDQHLHQLASEELWDFKNITMLKCDVLHNKNKLSNEVLDAIATHDATNHFKLVANLPYNIATPLISNLLGCANPPQSITVTIQKEVAERMLAKPSTKHYGHLSVWVQSQCRVECIRLMPPSVFWPRPKVESAIIQLTLEKERRDDIPDLLFFHRFTRALFLHRRKFLRSVVASAMKRDLEKSAVDAAIANAGLQSDQRAEQLSVEKILTLCEAVRDQLSQKNA